MDEKGSGAIKEIDIISIIKKIFAEFKLLVGFVGVFAIIGVIVALNKPKSYTANVVLAPEIGSGMGLSNGISDLASMVGVDLSSGGKNVDAIYPEIYPDVFASTDFILSIFDVKVKTKAGEEKTYFNHLLYDRKIPFWNYPTIWFAKLLTKKTTGEPKKLNPFQLTKIEFGIANLIRSNISCTVDKKTSVISIGVEDEDPVVSAIVADTLRSRLQDYITLYRTKKARNDLAYAEKLYRDAKQQYERSRQRYGSYSDANTDVVLMSYKSKQEDLENEMQLRFNAYTQMSQQMQLAKAKVQEKTPAFTIIQNASVPLKASSTPRMLTVLIYIIFGVVMDALWVLYIRDFIKSRKKK